MVGAACVRQSLDRNLIAGIDLGNCMTAKFQPLDQNSTISLSLCNIKDK